MPQVPSPHSQTTANNSTFSIVKSFLTDWQHYLLSLAAALAELAGLKLAMSKFHTSDWPIYFLATIPPLIVFVCKTVPRLLEEHRQNILIKSSRDEDAQPHPMDGLSDYFLIGPYSKDRYLRFLRADKIHEKVLHWVQNTEEAILVLTGLSGAGKSSLLQAFVVPAISSDSQPYKVLFIRGFDDPLIELRDQIISFWDRPPENVGSKTLFNLLKLGLARLKREHNDTRLLIIFDQFEEFIVLQNEFQSRGTAVKAFLQEIGEASLACCTFLLAVRSDYKSLLEPLGVPLLNEGNNWIEVPPFIYTDAENFLTAPESALKIPTGRLRRVLTEAAAVDGTRGLIRPIILNMLGVVLRRIADRPAAEQPTRTLLAGDLRAVVNDLRWREVAHAILPHLLTESDTKRPQTVGALHTMTGLAPHAINGCLLDLAHAGYVRELSRSTDIKDRLWEISHDFVARLLGPILKTPLATVWNRTRAIVYPISAASWVVAFIAYLVLAPWYERDRVEEVLRDIFKFHLEYASGSYTASETSTEFNSLEDASPWLDKLKLIRYLDLSGCTLLTDIDPLAKSNELRKLKGLYLNGCTALTNINGIADFKLLEELNLNECEHLDSINNLRKLRKLRKLRLSNCSGLTSIEMIENFRNLEELYLNSCPYIENIAVLRNLAALKTLDLSGCKKVTNFSGITNLKALHSLTLTSCDGLENVDGFNTLDTLHDLRLDYCSLLKNTEGLNGLPTLLTLDLSGCVSLSNVSGLSKLYTLDELHLSLCNVLTSIDGLRELRNLRTLDLNGCDALLNVDALENLVHLKVLNLSGCVNISSVDPLSKLVEIQKLEAKNCYKLANIDSLRNIKSLNTLDLDGCAALSSLDGLKDLEHLQSLQIEGCIAVKELNPLKNHFELRELYVSGCTALMDINALRNLKGLKKLDITGCKSLQRREIEQLQSELVDTTILTDTNTPSH